MGAREELESFRRAAEEYRRRESLEKARPPISSSQARPQITVAQLEQEAADKRLEQEAVDKRYILENPGKFVDEKGTVIVPHDPYRSGWEYAEGTRKHVGEMTQSEAASLARKLRNEDTLDRELGIGKYYRPPKPESLLKKLSKFLGEPPGPDYPSGAG